MEEDPDKLIEQAREAERVRTKDIIAPGVYMLREPVQNTHPDRRRTREWVCAEFFPVGRYIVREDLQRGLRLEREGAYGDFVFWQVTTAPPRVGVVDKEAAPGVNALIQALEPDPSVDAQLAWLDRGDYIPWRHVLRRLIESGAVSMDAIKVAVQAERESA